MRPIDDLPRTSSTTIKRLKSLDIATYGDLLLNPPMRYEDRSSQRPIYGLQVGDKVMICGKVVSSKNAFTKNRKAVQSVVIADGSGQITATWFNQSYITQMLRAGVEVAVWGECRMFGRVKSFIPLDYEVKGSVQSLHMGRIVPIYAQTRGLSSKTIREKVAMVLRELDEQQAAQLDCLPAEVVQKYDLTSTKRALHDIHFPPSTQAQAIAKRRLGFDELFVLQLAVMLIRAQWKREELSHRFDIQKYKKDTDAFVARLPYRLTGAQERSIHQIFQDLSGPHPMNRFLQGDVGSGKTIVAAAAAYLSHLNGYQTLVMAPTEILANQHYQSFTELFKGTGVRVALQTKSHKDIKKTKAKKKKSEDAEQEFDVVVGTHALLNEAIVLSRVGLVVIDEQHRFGVRQRNALRAKGIHAHLLTMTATPIPRTVALTMFGELEMSVLNEMPVGRKQIRSYLVPPAKRAAAYDWVKQYLARGQQMFVICPFVEESEHETSSSVKAATVEYERLSKQVFSTHKVGMLHGKMKSAEKDEMMRDFRAKKYEVLVATSVVEVGIDVPNATIILIEGAERFGLAQLHQLRGRVGRGAEQSHCLLFTSEGVWGKTERLQYFAAHPLGIDIAEYDLKHRGTGDIFGTRQHGVEDLRIASLADTVLISQTQTAATAFIDSYSAQRYPALAARLVQHHVEEIAKD